MVHAWLRLVLAASHMEHAPPHTSVHVRASTVSFGLCCVLCVCSLSCPRVSQPLQKPETEAEATAPWYAMTLPFPLCAILHPAACPALRAPQPTNSLRPGPSGSGRCPSTRPRSIICTGGHTQIVHNCTVRSEPPRAGRTEIKPGQRHLRWRPHRQPPTDSRLQQSRRGAGCKHWVMLGLCVGSFDRSARFKIIGAANHITGGLGSL